jgi:hypothetical protein
MVKDLFQGRTKSLLEGLEKIPSKDTFRVFSKDADGKLSERIVKAYAKDPFRVTSTMMRRVRGGGGVVHCLSEKKTPYH